MRFFSTLGLICILSCSMNISAMSAEPELFVINHIEVDPEEPVFFSGRWDCQRHRQKVIQQALDFCEREFGFRGLGKFSTAGCSAGKRSDWTDLFFECGSSEAGDLTAVTTVQIAMGQLSQRMHDLGSLKGRYVTAVEQGQKNGGRQKIESDRLWDSQREIKVSGANQGVGKE